MRPAPTIACFAVALTCSLLSFMTVAAVLPDLIAAWSLDNTQAGWLGGIFFAGYISAVLILASLTDRIDPRRIYLTSALVGAGASLGMALMADGFASAMILRFLTGVGLAGTYMPGLRALTEQLPPETRNRGVVYYASVFALGSGLSILVGGEVGAVLGWRWAFAIGGLGFAAAYAIALAVMAPSPRRREGGSGTNPLDFRPVLRNRQVMGYVVAFVGTAWEVFALRIWMVAFLVHLHGRGGDFLLSPTVLATLLAFAGIPASMALGELCSRLGRRRLLAASAGASLALSLAVGFAASGSYALIVGLSFLLGTTSYGRNAATTGGMMEWADERVRGATMALYSFIGFSGGIMGPLAMGITLDLAGGRTLAGAWTWGFMAVAAGAAITLTGLLLIVRQGTPGPTPP